MKSRARGVLLSFVWMAATLPAVSDAADPPRFEFTRMIAHWAEYADPAYLDFVSEAQPEVAQFGFYGAHFWSLAHTEHGKGYPAHFPLVGLAENREWFARMNCELHDRGVKVVGHMNVKFLVGDPEGPDGPRGFFHFYRNLWDEKLLGPKPVDDPLDLLEKKKDGTPITNSSYSIGKMKEYWACLNNPHWRQVLKAWTKYGIEQGADGFIANYFYRHDCHCEHCVAGFKNHLRERYSPAQLKAQFGIDDLETQVFDEIVAWHKPDESTPLRREMLQFSQIGNKRAFDEVFLDYGRSLKPDLIAAQWNHLSNFSQISGDERCLLPADLWGKGEDYLWYSTGAAAFYTDLENGFLGEGTLQARYIRGAFDDKPFTLGKYESTRTRVSIAELAANGGAPMGFYTRFRDPEARREIARYYQFMKRNDPLLKASRSHAEVLLLYPRSEVHGGNVAAVDQFKTLGMELLNRHVLFDVRPNDLPSPEPGEYAVVIDPTKENSLSTLPKELSRFEAPATVRVSTARPAEGRDLLVHLVNYNRTEPEKKKSAGRGIADEKPIAVDGIAVDLQLPAGFTPGRATFLTPESSDATEIPVQTEHNRLRLRVPSFLVYGIVRIEPLK